MILGADLDRNRAQPVSDDRATSQVKRIPQWVTSGGVVWIARLGRFLEPGADMIGALGTPLALGDHRCDAQGPAQSPPVDLKSAQTAPVMGDRRQPGRRECDRSKSGGAVDQTIIDTTLSVTGVAKRSQGPRVPKVGVAGDMEPGARSPEGGLAAAIASAGRHESNVRRSYPIKLWSAALNTAHNR
jgi:hypothetical protein